MSGTLQLPTTGTFSGLTEQGYVNTALAALANANQGASAPTAASTGLTGANPLAGVYWHDTGGAKLNVRDQGDTTWMKLFDFDETNKVAIPAGLGLMYGLRNKLINGGMHVGQRSAPNLSTSFQYGAVDCWMAAATAGTVGAGTIALSSAAAVGRTGYALQLAGVTTTVAGTMSVKQRIESGLASTLKNQTASFTMRVYHDVGSAINYQITIRKPTAADTYTSTTQIAQSSLISVASATDTLITLENVAMGDCSNGIEVQVDAISGVVTTKNFYFTEAELDEAATSYGFEYRHQYLDLLMSLRYFWAMSSQGIGIAAASNNLYTMGFLAFPVPMRVAPSLLAGATFSANVGSNGTVSLNASSINNANIGNSASNWTVGALVTLSGAQFSAEL